MAPELDDFPTNLQEPIANIIKKEGYVTCEVDKKAVGATGASFLARLYTISIKGKTRDGEKKTEVFVKSIIPINNMEAVINLKQAYASEAFVYNELSKIFHNLQEEAAIPLENRFKIMKSYGVSNSEAIFMENVALKGYKSCDRTYMMSLEVAEKTLKELAKFHALSFVMEAKNPEYYRCNIETITHPFIFGEEFDKSALYVARVASKHLKDGSREKVEMFLSNYAAKWRQYHTDSTSTKCCLCHGDFRLNNLLMKHDGDKLEDMYVVDYQLMNIGNPINDFLFFIFTGTDQQFREKHLDHLKDLYYMTFSGFLEKFHLDSEDIYPRKEFENDYKARLDYGLVVALYFLPFFLAAEDAVPDLGEQAVTDMDFVVMEECNERIQGIVDDYIAWGYL